MGPPISFSPRIVYHMTFVRTAHRAARAYLCAPLASHGHASDKTNAHIRVVHGHSTTMLPPS
jgi:hypothetical protein